MGTNSNSVERTTCDRNGQGGAWVEWVEQRGEGDIRAMQSVVARLWSPGATRHIGDLAWERRHLPDRDRYWTSVVVREGGAVLGFASVAADGELEIVADPVRPELAGALVQWSLRTAGGASLAASVSDAEPHLIAALLEAGFTERPDAPYFVHMIRGLRHLPAPRVHSGVRFRASRGREDLERLWKGHQASWDQSRVSLQSLQAVTSTWPYESALHIMAEDAGGRVLASAIAWWDADNQVAEFEPVGTHRDFRRQGLASGVIIHALHLLADRGARLAVVYARGDDAYPVPQKVYARLGFEVAARTRTLAWAPHSHGPG